MTVQRLYELLGKQIENGNGHLPIGLVLENFGVEVSAGLFGDVKIGVQDQYDKVWIVGKGGMKMTRNINL